MMGIWYFTFCNGDPIHGGYCQPIKASSYGAARAKMFEMYGEKWAFQYSEEEWNDAKKRGYLLERELELVEVKSNEKVE